MTTETLTDKLKRTAEYELSKGGFDGNYKLTEFSERPAFTGGIDVKSFSTILMQFNPAYEEENEGKSEVVVRDITRHEINHKGYRGFSGCPRNLDLHVEKIFEPISDVLKPKNYSGSDAHYVANAFEDTILHADLKREFSLEGIAHMLEEVGKHSDNGKFSSFYEAHARLNLMLWGNRSQKGQVANYFQSDATEREKVVKALQAFWRRAGLDKLTYQVETKQGKIKVKDRQKIRNFLNNEQNWPKLSKIYAEEFSKLMQPNYAMPLPNHSGAGTKGREQEESKPSDGNAFDRQMESEEYKQKRISKAYEEGKGIPSWMDTHEALDLLYQGLARKLQIKAETFTEQMQRPVVHYGERTLDPERDDLRRVTFGFDDKGKIELKRKPWNVSVSIPYKIKPKSFPEARFCLMDTSGSMKYNINNEMDAEGNPIKIGVTSLIPWGDESKYHYALLGWYGFIEYLKQNHILSNMGINLGNFSEQTVLKQGLRESKKLALSPQFGNRTEIDADKVKEVFEGRDKLIFTASDGEIHNWSTIKLYFINGAQRHQYFHLQIGAGSTATTDLQKAGLHVSQINNAQDLARRVIDLTDRLYRG